MGPGRPLAPGPGKKLDCCVLLLLPCLLLEQVMTRVRSEGVGWLSQAFAVPAAAILPALHNVSTPSPGLPGHPVRRSQPPLRLSPSLSPPAVAAAVQPRPELVPHISPSVGQRRAWA